MNSCTSELVLSEQRMLLDHERQQQIENMKKSFMKEREEIIKETKKKQWVRLSRRLHRTNGNRFLWFGVLKTNPTQRCIATVPNLE